jgi:hypothetical protein
MRFVMYTALVALALAGCSSKSSGGSGPTASFDAAGFDVNFNEDGGVVDAGHGSDASAEAESDASALGPGCSLEAGAPDGGCNTLENVATPITGTCETAAQPMGTGGTIAAGTYVLTAQARYMDAGCVPATYQVTMLIADGCLERVDGTGASALHRNQNVSTNGNELLRTSSCGPGLPAATYTATGTQLTIFDQGGAVTTWTKQ